MTDKRKSIKIKKKSKSKKADNKELTVKVSRVGKHSTTFDSGLLAGSGSESQSSSDPAVLASHALQYEDEFAGKYGLAGYTENNGVVIIEPPYNPLTLEKLINHNNTLGPCIDAMITNIDGTGFEIIDKDTKDEASKKGIDKLTDFFAEPWPGISFAGIRQNLRRDLETVGYGFLEVVRNVNGDIVLLRHVEAKTMRLIKLGNPHTVTREITRGGEPVKYKVQLRFRRFVQNMGTKLSFFKEFNAEPEVNKKTGKWIESGSKVALEDRGGELMYFTLKKDVNTPYGVPRWVSQMPSVLGSRQAEENNLEYFKSGGVPPFMMIVSGGILAEATRDAIDGLLASDGDHKQRGMVVEAHSSSGSLDDSGGKVKVSVEKFGAGANQDSQFEGYDDKCALRVRGSFRLSEIFLGRSAGNNYASAFVAYMVGEAQVFIPERNSFDTMITLNLLPSLMDGDVKGLSFRSLPLSVNDVKERLAALQIGITAQALTKGEIVKTINEVAGMGIRVAKGEGDVLASPAKAQGPTAGLTAPSELTDASTAGPKDPKGTASPKGKPDNA